MFRNTASQTIGAQMLTAADGSAFTGSVTVYVTGDGGVQAVGSVGSGACVHEGNGYHSYAPAQAETNYSHVAFTFIGTGAAPATVQVYTKTGDAFARLGAPVGASISADIATVNGKLPALVGGRVDASVGAMAANVLTAAATAADYVTEVQGAAAAAITAASLATAANVAAVETDTQDLQNRLPAALVGGRIDANIGAAAANVITAASLAADAGTEIAAAVAANATIAAGITNMDAAVSTRLATAGYTAPANATIAAIDARLPSDPADQSLLLASSTAIYDRLGAPAGASIAADIEAIDAGGGGGLDAAGVRAAIGMAAANLDTQLAALQTDTNDIQARLPAALVGGRMDANTGAMSANVVTAAALAADAGAEIASAVLTTEMTEDYAARGAQITAAQGLYMVLSLLAERRVVGDVLTTGALDGSAAMTFLLDDVVAPTEQTRAS